MNCDKCGHEVPSNNDASILDAIIADDNMLILAKGARHVLPVIEDGEVICAGSPSRAQYLEGQPRDLRFPYDQEREVKVHAAWEKLQTEAVGEAAGRNLVL